MACWKPVTGAEAWFGPVISVMRWIGILGLVLCLKCPLLRLKTNQLGLRRFVLKDMEKPLRPWEVKPMGQKSFGPRFAALGSRQGR